MADDEVLTAFSTSPSIEVVVVEEEGVTLGFHHLRAIP
jgi:hypothetical protein